MKTKMSFITRIILLMGFAILLFSGCKKETTETSGEYYFNCKIGGVSYVLEQNFSDIGNFGGTLKNTVTNETIMVNLYAADFLTKEAAEYNDNGNIFKITSYDKSKSEVKGTFTTATFGNNVATEGSFYLFVVQ